MLFAACLLPSGFESFIKKLFPHFLSLKLLNFSPDFISILNSTANPNSNVVSYSDIEKFMIFEYTKSFNKKWDYNISETSKTQILENYEKTEKKLKKATYSQHFEKIC